MCKPSPEMMAQLILHGLSCRHCGTAFPGGIGRFMPVERPEGGTTYLCGPCAKHEAVERRKIASAP